MSINKLSFQRMFQNLSREQLELIYETGNVFTIGRGETIIQEGQIHQHLYFILDGEVDVYTMDDPDDPESRKLLTTLGPGDSVGEYGFIDGRPASASVEAADTSELFALAKPLLEKVLDTDADLERRIYKNLLITLVDRLRTTNVIIDFLRFREDNDAPDIH